jgi:methionine sulfoxide reductase heme-binding subunit
MMDGTRHYAVPEAPHPVVRPARNGDLRRRLVRHHLPVAAVSVLTFVAFMTLPTFNRSTEHEAAAGGDSMPAQATPAPSGHGDQSGSTGHGGQSGSSGHGGDQPAPSHESTPAPSMEHEGGQEGSIDPVEGMSASDDRTFVRQFTLATGYVATGLLGVTLLIGPLNLVLRRRNPVSSYLRRDVGLWTVVFSVVHVGFGLQVHGALSDFMNYFLAPDGSPLTDAFGLGNWTGLAATVIAVGLLALSSDFALRKLTARPWKRLQRLNYALFVLVLAHAVFYGALSRTTSPFTLLLGLIVVAVFVGQTIGVWLWRRKAARPAAGLA